MSFTRYTLDEKVFITCSYVETKSRRAVSRNFKAEYNKTLPENYVFLDFFLWGCLKNKVYSGVKATTLAGLKLRIQEAFEETRLETMSLIKTYDNALYRMKLVSENGGKHIEISVKNRKNLVV